MTKEITIRDIVNKFRDNAMSYEWLIKELNILFAVENQDLRNEIEGLKKHIEELQHNT